MGEITARGRHTALNLMAAALVLVLLLLSGCTTTRVTDENPMPGLDAVFWQQKAPEYRATTRSLFAHARRQLETAKAQPDWTAAVEQLAMGIPYPDQTAVILDIDETVLNNTPLYARQVQDPGYAIGTGWSTWTDEARAVALAGAVAFIRHALAQGVEVFFVSNRSCTQDEATRKNLAACGFPTDHPNLHMISRNTHFDDPSAVDSCPEMEAYVREVFGVEAPRWSLYKGARRATIAAKYRILLLLGDSQGDFYSLEPAPEAPSDERKRLLLAHLTPAERERIDEQYGQYFEDRWIPLPNAFYGNWQSSFIQYRSLTVAEQAKAESAMLSTE